MRRLLTLLCLLLALPVLAVLGSWLSFDASALAVLRHQAQTVMLGYAGQSLLLTGGVAVGVVTLGVACAVAVSLFSFPGRAVFEWALLLPLAMPGYVLAYAYTDALQYSGPVQSVLRGTLGLQGALWPDVRSLWGAVLLFVLSLYPYVYLLTRAALGEGAAQPLEAARLLGAGLVRRIATVALPLARPAVVAGTALALMETLADYGVGSYFGLSTFTTGIYRAWLSMNDANAAAQLASILLVAVALLLAIERRAQSRMRFAGSRNGPAQAGQVRALALPCAAAWFVAMGCLLPVLLGFVLPAVWLAVMLGREALGNLAGLPLARFALWAWSSFKLAAMAAVAATLLALAVGFAIRQAHGGRGRLFRMGVRVLSLGYAVPGAVVALGIMLPVAWVQARWPTAGAAALFTGTIAGLLFAYLVRFSAVALQSVEAGYTRVPLSVDETSRVLGAGRSKLFFRVHLPLLGRSAWAAGLLVFVDTMKELPATLLLRPFGSDTLAVVAYNLARDERLAEAALPSLAIVAVGLLPVILLARTVGRPQGATVLPAG